MTETKREGLDRNSCLYHYTSAQGLQGILRSRSLWATDAAFLNDSQEIKYSAEPLIARMSEILAANVHDKRESWAVSSTPQNYLEFMESALEAIQTFVTSDRQTHAAQNDAFIDAATYVACLSEEHDQLGQWRAYGRRGYAIGLTREGLEEAAPRLDQVRYGESEVNRLCDKLIGEFETQEKSAFHPSLGGFIRAVLDIMPELALVKHEAFHQEREWRLVVRPLTIDRTEIRVRVSSEVVPYVECTFPQSCIAEIVIGPGGDFHSERAVRALLRANGYDPAEVQITQSRAPFRGWGD
jgi:Protein of unknown function (DUF2971)